MFRFSVLLLIVPLLLISSGITAQYIVSFAVDQSDLLVADAGKNQGVGSGTILQLGGQPAVTGGTPPYQILWSPSYGLDDPTLPNPTLTADSSLTYTLSATDSIGCTSESSVNVEILIGTEELSGEDKAFIIYPNPASNNLINIKNLKENLTAFDVVVTDMKGQEIHRESFSQGTSEISINNNSITNGIYLITIHSGTVYHYKIVVQ